MGSQQIADHFRDDKRDRPKLQDLKMLRTNAKWRWKRGKGGSPNHSASPTYLA
ncbi:hypothetical protein MTR67_011698 [Solanum verrucosum]|uniref:Uncharacterized protein n=1 Tax=Solanum verrucosum TaxID=315347 RepID=A0AAF0Q8J6_SOLVR|nr:hypothetical protein MTR67_011698 [Solanum verrucosum]